MSGNPHPSSETPSSGNQKPGNGPQQFIIFLGSLKLGPYTESPVKASRILEDGGAVPAAEFTLEATQGQGGRALREYQPGDDVHLDNSEAKFFRAVPRGGGRA